MAFHDKKKKKLYKFFSACSQYSYFKPGAFTRSLFVADAITVDNKPTETDVHYCPETGLTLNKQAVLFLYQKGSRLILIVDEACSLIKTFLSFI